MARPQQQTQQHSQQQQQQQQQNKLFGITETIWQIVHGCNPEMHVPSKQGSI